jgi:hypothetical protein
LKKSVLSFFSFVPGPIPVVDGLLQFDTKLERKNLFTMDIGGVLEMYPSRRNEIYRDHRRRYGFTLPRRQTRQLLASR